MNRTLPARVNRKVPAKMEATPAVPTCSASNFKVGRGVAGAEEASFAAALGVGVALTFMVAMGLVRTVA